MSLRESLLERSQLVDSGFEQAVRGSVHNVVERGVRVW